MRLYNVEFKFTSGYSSPKAEGLVNVSLVVVAHDQFEALGVAWRTLEPLNLPEPKSFNAQTLDKD